LGDKRWIGFTLSDLGELARVDGDLNRALGLGQEGLAVLDGVGEKLGIAVGLERLAWVCVAQQRPAEIAVQLIGAAHALRIEINSPRAPREDGLETLVRDLRRDLGEAAFEAAWCGTSETWTGVRLALELSPLAARRVRDPNRLSEREQE